MYICILLVTVHYTKQTNFANKSSTYVCYIYISAELGTHFRHHGHVASWLGGELLQMLVLGELLPYNLR